MPTYTYHCKTCEEVFQVKQRIVEDPLEKKPECEKKDCKVQRLITGGDFILKGGGWYKDGYSSTKKKEKK